MADEKKDQDEKDQDKGQKQVAADDRRGLVPVTFLESYPPYNANETAGVDADLAQRLVSKGKARYHELRHDDGRPAFDGDQPVDLAVAPNHPMRSPTQLAEQQIPSDGLGHAVPAPGARALPNDQAPDARTTSLAGSQDPSTVPGTGAAAKLDTSAGRDMKGTSEKDSGKDKGKK